MSNRMRVVLTLGILLALGACQTTPPPAPAPEAAAAPEPASETPQPAPAAALFELAMWSRKNDQPEKAISQFRELIELDAQYPNAHTNLGLLLLQQQQPDAAKSEFLTAIEQDNQDSIAYNHLAIIERQQGSFKQARDYYRKALEADPDYANAHLNIGILLDIYLQELPAALGHYQKYQQLTDNSNKDVDKWIVDIKRRMDKK